MSDEVATSDPAISNARKAAFRLVLLLGVVSLFGDMTYEGARAITGPYLAILGASATVVGVVAGLGELAGYGLRLVSGVIADRTRRYWAVTIVGYVINMLAVPLLALTGSWQAAAILIVAERVGKAIRTPARDAMLSHAASQVGGGRAFGIHEAMDQIGAIVGPLLVAVVLARTGDYQMAFAVLLVPALFALGTLAITRVLHPRPGDLETNARAPKSEGMARPFVIYLAAVAFIGAGYADFILLAFHFEKTALLSASVIPLVYAVAMASDAAAALLFGRLFDRFGIAVLMASTILSAFFAPLAFFGGPAMAVIGVALWGIGMGAQESIMRATVAQLAPPDLRGSAYGAFNAAYGIAWFLGSVAIGVLYDWSIPAVVVFSVGMQTLALPLLWLVRGFLR